eukprot:UN23315
MDIGRIKHPVKAPSKKKNRSELCIKALLLKCKSWKRVNAESKVVTMEDPHKLFYFFRNFVGVGHVLKSILSNHGENTSQMEKDFFGCQQRAVFNEYIKCSDMVEYGQSPLFELLEEKNVDETKRYTRILGLICSWKRSETINKRFWRDNYSRVSGWTFLGYLATAELWSLVNLFCLKQKSYVIDGDGNTICHYAVQIDDMYLLKTLIQNVPESVDVERWTDDYTPLHLAIANKNGKACRLLLEKYCFGSKFAKHVKNKSEVMRFRDDKNETNTPLHLIFQADNMDINILKMILLKIPTCLWTEKIFMEMEDIEGVSLQTHFNLFAEQCSYTVQDLLQKAKDEVREEQEKIKREKELKLAKQRDLEAKRLAEEKAVEADRIAKEKAKEAALKEEEMIKNRTIQNELEERNKRIISAANTFGTTNSGITPSMKRLFPFNGVKNKFAGETKKLFGPLSQSGKKRSLSDFGSSQIKKKIFGSSQIKKMSFGPSQIKKKSFGSSQLKKKRDHHR